MTLSEISIRRPVFAWMLMAALIVFGAISFHRIGISQLPDVDFPVVSVSLSLPGAAPEVVESQVLDTVEDAIMELDGIRSVTSTAQQSSGRISVEFELNRNIDQAMQEIQNKIQQVRNLLPVNLMPPSLRKSNPEDQPILWLALTSDDPQSNPMDMMIFARNFLLDNFSTVDGVGDVALGGYVDPALRVWADRDALNRLQMTTADIVNAIKTEHLETPVGIVENENQEYYVRLKGEATTPEEFGKINIGSRLGLGANYQQTPLSQVAKVEEGLTDIRRKSRVNGKRTVALGIIKQHGSKTLHGECPQRQYAIHQTIRQSAFVYASSLSTLDVGGLLSFFRFVDIDDECLDGDTNIHHWHLYRVLRFWIYAQHLYSSRIELSYRNCGR